MIAFLHSPMSVGLCASHIGSDRYDLANVNEGLPGIGFAPRSKGVNGSFFEGLGLVLVEALACGCRLVSTDLEGVREELAPHLGSALDLVPLPRLRGADRPVREDLPSFVIALEEGLGGALGKPPLEDPETAFSEALARFTWEAVFRRVEAVWEELCEG